MVRTNSEGLSAAELVARRRLAQQKGADVAKVRRLKSRHTITLAPARAQADRNRALAQKDARSAAFEKIRADGSRLLRKQFLVRDRQERAAARRLADLRRQAAAARNAASKGLTLPKGSIPPTTPSYKVKHYTAAEIRNLTRVGEWNQTMQDQRTRVDVARKGNVADLEKLLADNAKRVADGQTAYVEAVKIATERYMAHIQAVAAAYKGLVGKINAALAAGNIKAARALYGSAQFRGTAAEFTRLYGDNGKNRGSVRSYFANYNRVTTAVNDYYAKQLAAATNQTRRQEERLNSRYGENFHGGIDYNDKTNPYLKQGFDVRRVDGELVRTKRTPEQEIEYRQRQQRLEMERLRGDYDAQEASRLRFNRGVGRVENVFRTPDGQTLDLDPVKQASRRTLREYAETLQQYIGHDPLGEAVAELKSPQQLQGFIDGAMQKWARDNRAVFGHAATTAGLRRDPHTDAFQAAFKKKESELYALFGAQAPGDLDRFFQLPGVSHVTSALGGGVGAIGSAGRKFFIKPLTGSSQVDFGVSIGDVPSDIALRARAAMNAAQSARGGNYSPSNGLILPVDARDKVIHDWLQTPEGQQFLADRGANVKAQDTKFQQEFYGTDDIGKKTQALIDYGGSPTSSTFANLLLQIVADPTNAIPLKFTTYLGRAAYAAEKSAGYANPVSKVLKGYRDFIQVTEADLRLDKFIGGLEQLGMSKAELVLRSEEAVRGIKTAAERESALAALLQRIGFDSRKVDVRQLSSLIEGAVGEKLKWLDVDIIDQGRKAELAVQEHVAREAAEQAARDARLAKSEAEAAAKSNAVKEQANDARAREQVRHDSTVTQLSERVKSSQPAAAPGRVAAGTGQPAATLHPSVPRGKSASETSARAPKPRVGPITAKDVEVRSHGHNVSPVQQKNLLTIAERAEESPDGLYSPRLQWHEEGGVTFVHGSAFLGSEDYKTLLERSKSVDVGEARAAFDEIALRARTERMRYVAALEDGGKFTADPGTIAERAGVSGAVDEAQIISQRKTIAYLKKAAQRAKGKRTAFLDDSVIVEGPEVYAGLRHGPGEYQRIEGAAGDLADESQDSRRYLIGHELSEISRATPALIRGLYESFSERLASRFSDPIFLKVRDAKWRKGLTETRFGKLLMPDEGGILGIDEFRFQGQAVFELFHRLRTDPAGGLAKIKKLTHWAELAGEADPENVLARMWLVMTERAGLDLAGDYKLLEADFLHAASAAGLVPSHALAMIPSGFNANRLPVRFGFGPRLSGIADSTSDRFLAAGARWNDTVARDSVSRIFTTELPSASQLASQVVHFATQKFGDIYPKSALVSRYNDELATLVRGSLRTPARLASLAEELARFDTREGGRTIRDMLAAPNRFKRAGKGVLGFNPDLHQILDDAYWAGALTHTNPAAHTLALLLRLQMRPDRWVSSVDRYIQHMAHAGAIVEAKEIVRDLFSSRIAMLNSRAYHEVYGGLKSGERAVDAATGEIALVGLTPEWKLWHGLGFVSDPKDIAEAQIKRPTAASLVDEGTDPNDPFIRVERDMETAPGANAQATASVEEFAQQFDEALERFSLTGSGSGLEYQLDRLVRELVPTKVGMAADDFAELDRLLTEVRKLPHGQRLIDAARDRAGNDLLASRVFAGTEAKKSVAAAVEPEPPVANLGSQTPANAATAELLQRIAGMTEQEWWQYEKQRAYRALKLKGASVEQKRLARARLRDISLAEYAAEIDRDLGATVTHANRVAHKDRVVAAHGADAKALISPKTVAPYVTGGFGAIVEQVRSLYRTLQSGTQDATSRVHALGEVSETYKAKAAAIDSHMERFRIPPAFWEQFPRVPEELRGRIKLMDLVADWDEFEQVVARGQLGLLDGLKEQVWAAGQRELRQVSGDAGYTLDNYLQDRIVHRGDHYDPAIFEHHEKVFAKAISDARGFTRDTLTDARRKGTGAGGPELAERELKVVLAKARVARELGVDVHAYNEARKFLRRPMVQKRTASWMARRARARAARLGTEYEDEFLRIRDYMAEREARKQLGALAYGEMYGHPPAEVLAEMVHRYGPDAHIRGYEPVMTAYQKRTLEEAVKYWSGVDDIADSALMSKYLTSEGSVPEGGFRNRAELSAFLVRIGAWSKRTAEDFKLGAKSWSFQDEAKFWQSSYALTPQWADEAFLTGDGAVMFHDTDAYFDQQRRWGIFNRQAEVADATAEDYIRGNVSKGIKEKRDLAAQRKYAIERYGELVWDGQKMTAMPWLMTEDELYVYLAHQTAKSMTSGLLRTAGELDGAQAAIEAALAKNDRFKNWVSSKEGPIESADIMEFGSDILAELLQHPTWVARKRDWVGHGLNAVASFNRALVFTNIGFLTTNVVDAVAIKGPWARFTGRRLITSGVDLSERAASLTLRDIGEEGVTSLFRHGEDRGFSLKGALEGIGSADGVMGKAVAGAMSGYRGASGILPHMAGKVESAVKLGIAQGMYDKVYARILARLGSEEVAHAATLEFIQKEVNRLWPHAGDGPLERLWSAVVPFGQYQIKNRILFLSEAVAHPAVLNLIDHVGDAIEIENRKRWEKEHPGEVLPPYLARRIELPWTREADGSVSFLDLTIFSDASRGLAPFYKAEQPQTYRDFFGQWIRLVNPSEQAGIIMFTNALGWTKKTVYVPILDANGFPTGKYRTEIIGLNEPWSQNAPTLGSVFGSSFFGVASLVDAFTKAGLTGSELTRVLAKVALFTSLGTYDPTQGLNLWYWELHAKDPAAAEEWLKTEDGARLLERWRNNAENPLPFFNPFKAEQVVARDKNPWFHSQSESFQQNVKLASAELDRIHDYYDDLIFSLTPGTEEYKAAKRNQYLNTLAVYTKYPDLLKATVWGKTGVEWATQLASWETDKLVDTFFAMNASRPKRADFKTPGAYADALIDWQRKKTAFLLEFPQVWDALHSAKSSIDRIWTDTEDEWGETLDRMTTRGIQIDAEKAHAAATQDYTKLDGLYLSQELDSATLNQDVVTLSFAPDQMAELARGQLGPVLPKSAGFLPTARVLLDFTSLQLGRMSPAEKLAYQQRQDYVAGMKRIIALAKASGHFDPALFVKLLRGSPSLLKAYFDKHPGKREQWAATDQYIKLIGRYGQLAQAGRFAEARSYFDSLPDWVKDRYYAKHPEKRHAAQQNVAYVGALGQWVKLLQAKDFVAAKKYFKSLPQWMQDRYYAKHPDAKLKAEALDRSGLLAEYFAADDANRPGWLEAHPAFAKWLLRNVGGSESQRRQAILIAYQALTDPWLKRVYRERYPEVFSAEAAGNRKLVSAARTLAEHPEMSELFERFMGVILSSFVENQKHTKLAPREPKVDHKRDNRTARRRKHRSAAWVRLHIAA